MGAIQPIFTVIEGIIQHLPPDRSTAELDNILGDIYWIKGDVRAAIVAQQQTIDYAIGEHKKVEDQGNISSEHQQYYLKMLEVDSLLSVGLYHIDLWELDIAQAHFQTVIDRASNTNHDRWAQKAKICLALVTSDLGEIETAKELLTQIERSRDREKLTGSSAYFLQILGQTYSNLGDSDRARELYYQTLDFCQTGNYLQIQAKTLTGLGEIDRLQGELNTAKEHHLHAIDILDRLGAKCDLAEAYFQAAITWNESGDIAQSKVYRDLAEQLFIDISAPKQVDKLNFLRKS
jgi:tetratricopeptide (TPR) repeat protein